jgi:hypothetical protein
MPSINVDVDISDLLWDLHRDEKQELVDELYDEGFVPKELKHLAGEGRDVGTYLEQELSNILNDIWSNRLFLTNDDIQNLKQLSTQGIKQ